MQVKKKEDVRGKGKRNKKKGKGFFITKN